MTSAYILVAAILLLGGLIAALGDRLGSKVGKARLRLFNMRPRQTATFITVLTGTTIAALTLGILFALSESLRQGIFELDEIQRRRRHLKADLEQVRHQKNLVEQELEKTRVKQGEVDRRLEEINQKFQQARAKLKTVSIQANALRTDVKSLLTEKQKLSQQREQLKNQTTQLKVQIQQRDRQLASQEQKITQRDKIIKEKEKRLSQLERQQSSLQAVIEQRDADLRRLEIQRKKLEAINLSLQLDAENLEKYYQSYLGLRGSRIALLRGQVLAFDTIRIVDPQTAIPTIERLLQQANRVAIEETNPEKSEFKQMVVIYDPNKLQQLVKKIRDGREYVVRILSAGNYVQGETRIQVNADIEPNRQIFRKGQTIATTSFDSAETISQQDIEQRVDWLVAASHFRARRTGILGKIQVEDGSNIVLFNFMRNLKQSEEVPEKIRAVVLETTYTAGPLKLRLIAVRNGEVIFSSES